MKMEERKWSVESPFPSGITQSAHYLEFVCSHKRRANISHPKKDTSPFHLQWKGGLEGSTTHVNLLLTPVERGTRGSVQAQWRSDTSSHIGITDAHWPYARG